MDNTHVLSAQVLQDIFPSQASELSPPSVTFLS
jgi:hypothetical protein